jgi:hypothetical protein
MSVCGRNGRCPDGFRDRRGGSAGPAAPVRQRPDQYLGEPFGEARPVCGMAAKVQGIGEPRGPPARRAAGRLVRAVPRSDPEGCAEPSAGRVGQFDHAKDAARAPIVAAFGPMSGPRADRRTRCSCRRVPRCQADRRRSHRGRAMSVIIRPRSDRIARLVCSWSGRRTASAPHASPAGTRTAERRSRSIPANDAREGPGLFRGSRRSRSARKAG